MRYEIKDNIIAINSEHTIEFDFNVKSVTEVNNVIIVLLDIPPKESMSENIFAVSDKGKILWQVESRPDLWNDPEDLYVDLGYDKLDEIVAFRWSCNTVVIDIHTGKIKSTCFTK